MAAPNIVNVTALYGKTNLATLTTTLSDILVNANSSNEVFKINTVICTNISNVSANATVSIYNADNNITYALINSIPIPAYAALEVITKVTSVYLEEGDKLTASASANSSINIIASYEDIA